MATTPYEDSPVTISERYESASNTSDLTVAASFGMVGVDEGTSAGDLIVAAGLSNSTIGMALLRLHGEWAGSPKPRRVTREGVERLAELIRLQDAKDQEAALRYGPQKPKPRKPAWLRASDEAHRWYVGELRLLATRLKTRRSVIDKLTAWGAVKGIPADVVCAAVHHWLDHVCSVCEGKGIRYLEHDVARQCHECDGTGEVRRPHGTGKVLTHIDYCIEVGRDSLKKRLRDLR